MKLFNIKLKNFCFFKGTFRVFHHYFFRCFHFFMFSCLHVFISSDVFGYFHCWLKLFTSLFFHCFSGTSSLCCCTVSAADLRECFLLSGVSYLTLLPAFIKAFLGPIVLPWRLQGFPSRLEIQTRPMWLFESHTVRQLYDK